VALPDAGILWASRDPQPGWRSMQVDWRLPWCPWVIEWQGAGRIRHSPFGSRRERRRRPRERKARCHSRRPTHHTGACARLRARRPCAVEGDHAESETARLAQKLWPVTPGRGSRDRRSGLIPGCAQDSQAILTLLGRIPLRHARCFPVTAAPYPNER